MFARVNRILNPSLRPTLPKYRLVYFRISRTQAGYKDFLDQVHPTLATGTEMTVHIHYLGRCLPLIGIAQPTWFLALILLDPWQGSLHAVGEGEGEENITAVKFLCLLIYTRPICRGIGILKKKRKHISLGNRRLKTDFCELQVADMSTNATHEILVRFFDHEHIYVKSNF